MSISLTFARIKSHFFRVSTSIPFLAFHPNLTRCLFGTAKCNHISTTKQTTCVELKSPLMESVFYIQSPWNVACLRLKHLKVRLWLRNKNMVITIDDSLRFFKFSFQFGDSIFKVTFQCNGNARVCDTFRSLNGHLIIDQMQLYHQSRPCLSGWDLLVIPPSNYMVKHHAIK